MTLKQRWEGDWAKWGFGRIILGGSGRSGGSIGAVLLRGACSFGTEPSPTQRLTWAEKEGEHGVVKGKQVSCTSQLVQAQARKKCT